MLLDIVSDCLGLDVAYAPAEFPWRPKMSFSEDLLQVGKCFAKLMGGATLEQPESLRYAHGEGKGNEQMYVVCTHMHVGDYDSVLVSGPDQGSLDKTKKLSLHERLAVFRAPLKVELI